MDGEAAPTTDQSSAISALFSTDATPAPEAPTTQAAGDTPPVVEPPEQFQAGRLPKQFHREDGQHDYDGLTKSWFELRQGHAAQSARVKELERQLSTTDEPWESYSGDFDWDAVKQRAPNAYLGGEADNQAAMSLLKRFHEAGLPKAKAAKAVGDYYADLDGMVGTTPTEVEQRKSAVAYLGPNGGTMAQEVQAFLESRAAVKPFSDEELATLGQMTRSGPALSILWQLSRRHTGAPPPSAVEASTVTDPETERREAAKMLGVDEATWQRDKAAILARFNRAYGEAA